MRDLSTELGPGGARLHSTVLSVEATALLDRIALLHAVPWCDVGRDGGGSSRRGATAVVSRSPSDSPC